MENFPKFVIPDNLQFELMKSRQMTSLEWLDKANWVRNWTKAWEKSQKADKRRREAGKTIQKSRKVGYNWAESLSQSVIDAVDKSEPSSATEHKSKRNPRKQTIVEEKLENLYKKVENSAFTWKVGSSNLKLSIFSVSTWAFVIRTSGSWVPGQDLALGILGIAETLLASNVLGVLHVEDFRTLMGGSPHRRGGDPTRRVP